MPIEAHTSQPAPGEIERVSVSEAEEKTPELFDISEFQLPKTDYQIPEATALKIQSLEQSLRETYADAKGKSENLSELEKKPEQAKNVWQIEQQADKLIYRDERGQAQEISFGELLTDGEWGLQYYFDKSVTDEIKLEYLKAEAQRKMHAGYNKALLLQELANPDLDEYKRTGYQAMLDDMESGQEHFGLQIEKAVKNFFKKISIDHQFFEVYDTDVKKDMRDKIDFILANVHHLQGVAVEEDPNAKKEIDVQFTTNLSPENIWNKSSQLQRAREHSKTESTDAIQALIKMDGRNFRFSQNRWAAKKTPGGPDKAWRAGTKWELFQQAMRKFLKPEEIDAYWTMLNKKK